MILQAETLPEIWRICWERFAKGAADPSYSFHQPALATAGIDGGAEARIVVLRAVDAEARVMEVFTDLAASKVDELRADPRGTLLFWASADRLQIRARLTFEVVSGASAADRWRDVAQAGRINYGGDPPTGTQIPAPDAYDKTPTEARFAVLRGRLDALDVVHLAEPHRRALYSAADGFAGTWLAP